MYSIPFATLFLLFVPMGAILILSALTLFKGRE